MAPKQPMLLPKGIVLNDPGIYREVASYERVPPEKLYQYWHVYTTTFRKLIDPTAYRLEQFWFRVWGSDRRNLPGKELAKLFEEFSDGPTFVPLRGPPNRYEGPPRPRRTHPPARPGPGPGIQSDVEATRERETEQGRRKDSASPDKAGLKEPAPSSSRPAPTHTILKTKPRGPSAPGTRPTARFVTPEEQAKDKAGEVKEETADKGTNGMVDKGKGIMKDEIKEEEEEVSGSKLTSGNDSINMPPPPRPSQSMKSDKKATPAKGPLTKKFSVSNTTAKRRPGIARRQGSQSSTDSIPGSSGTGARYLGSHREVKTEVVNGDEDKSVDEGSSGSSVGGLELALSGSRSSGKRPPPAVLIQDSESSPSQNEQPVLSAKALGKQPMKPGHPKGSLAKPQDGEVSRAPQQKEAPPPVAGFVADQQRAEVPTHNATRRSAPMAITPMLRSLSKEGQAKGQPSTAFSDLKAETLFKSANNFTPSAKEAQMTAEVPSNHPGYVNKIPANAWTDLSERQDGLAKPTPPNPTPEIPFGRTRSLLNMLQANETKHIERQQS